MLYEVITLRAEFDSPPASARPRVWWHWMNGNYNVAAWFILVSSIFDALDGKVARLTGTTSRFGVEYDSLASYNFV